MFSIKCLKSLRPESPIGWGAFLVLNLAGVGGLGFLILYYNGPIYSPLTWQPEQPIAYSHKLHAGDLKIDCQYCHTYARRSEMAGIPSMKKCMNCHSNVSKESPELTKLMKHLDEETSVEWVRVFQNPDHVWFNHKRHIKKGFACQKCHGPIEEMEVVGKTFSHKMGFCLDCHQENEAPTDCWTCHT